MGLKDGILKGMYTVFMNILVFFVPLPHPRPPQWKCQDLSEKVSVCMAVTTMTACVCRLHKCKHKIAKWNYMFLNEKLYSSQLPRLCETGRICYDRVKRGSYHTAVWDGGRLQPKRPSPFHTAVCNGPRFTRPWQMGPVSHGRGKSEIFLLNAVFSYYYFHLRS